MQRYHGGSCTSAVNNSTIGGPSARDSSRLDSTSLPPNFSRRPLQLNPYKLKCDKEPLNSRLGPPDFQPQTPNCPEETLTKEYVQSGYRETVEGLEEAREISLSQVQAFTKPVIFKCKEAIRKCHRAINESRAQKRKAGQVYGVPLEGLQLTKPGIFPDQRSCGEEFRKKWIEGLSQQHKRLRSLADHVPHGYRRNSLFEVLIRNNVPLLRATWFVKVTYLNQVRPGSSSISSGLPDKTHISRSDQWTKDVIAYLQYLLDEFISSNGVHSALNIRDRSQQMVYAGSVQVKSDPTLGSIDSEEPSLHFKWWYVVRLLQWHHREGLLIPSLIIDWMLNQLQEKELLGVLQLLLPVIYGFIDTIVLSQCYVRSLVGIAIRFIQEPSPGGADLVDNSRRAYTTAALVEMLRYLMLAVPDTFVALDCFPMPPCVMTNVVTDGSLYSKVAEDARKVKNGPFDVAYLLRDKGPEVRSDSYSIARVVSSIEKRAQNLAMAARPGHPRQSIAKALHALDKALGHGDLREAYKLLFENVHDSSIDDCWFAEVSSCLRSSLKHVGSVTLSSICSVFFICEWATCDFRDFRYAPPSGMKFTGRKDISAIYIAVRLLKLKMREAGIQSRLRGNKIVKNDHLRKDPGQLTNSGKNPGSGVSESLGNSKRARGKCGVILDMFDSPSPLHDILVCWIDQHEVKNTEGFKRLQLLIIELIRAGIFYPQAYVRQLIVSGIIDGNGSLVDPIKQQRHCKILKHLPGPYIYDALEEARIAESHVLSEVMNVYCNERKLVLHKMVDHHSTACGSSSDKRKPRPISGGRVSPPSIGHLRSSQSGSFPLSENVGRDAELEELKGSISALLQFPSSSPTDPGVDESQVSLKKAVVSGSNGMDNIEGTPGCEECRRAKKQKLSEEKSSYTQIYPQNPSDDEETWWMRRGQKSVESLRAEPPPKPAKLASRGRQKIVRKTQSLAQLAAARIEGSQGASTSHVCDSKISCPHHRPGVEGNVPKPADGTRMPNGDVVSIGKVLKRLRFVEKRTISLWLIGIVKQLVEEAEKTSTKAGQYGRPLSAADERGCARWKLSEDELSSVLYLIDACGELLLAARFLLWLLPKVLGSCSATVHGSRSILTIPKNTENNVCEVGESYLLSSMRRYESIIVAADLIPETLSVVMHRAQAILALNGRLSGSPPVIYARYLLKKYGIVGSVIEWEKNVKSTFDKRLASEVESGRLLDGEFGFPLGVPVGVQDLDDFFRQKITGVRVSRVGLNMRDIVQKKVDEVVNYFYGKDRKLFGPNSGKSPGFQKWEDGYQIGQQIVMGLMDCMRQTGGAAQEGDPTLVSSAISAIVCNVGPVIAKIPDLTASNNHLSFSSTSASLHFARCILRIHVVCLCILKEALGERQSRVFEVALATETSSALAQVFAPGKAAARSQFQLSPESNDSNMSSDTLNNSGRVALGRGAKISAAVSALVIGAILQGVTSLERMVSLFRLKDGLDVVHFVRSMRSTSNGNARSVGTLKADSLAEVSVHWFRVLVGNCRTVSDGFIVDLLGEASILALCRMQRMLPSNLVFPPAYSMFAFVLWRQLILNASTGTRDESQQLHHSLVLAVSDVIRHLPFREVCLRDTHSLYDLIAADTVDYDFASLLEASGVDMRSKASAFVPLRARLFLNALIDCRIPQQILKQDDGNQAAIPGDSKFHCAESETKLLDKLVYILDTLQPAKFHWQWVELRLLLNEQAVIEKLEGHDLSLVEALRSLSPNTDKASVSENESNIIEMILTRLLVRPDAAPLFSEVVHLLGRSLEDSMLLQAKWFLGGQDVLFGRKSVRQRLLNIAVIRGLSTKAQYWKPWGWCPSNSDPATSKGGKLKSEISSIEEGELVDEGTTVKRPVKGSGRTVDVDGFQVTQQHVTERALVDLILPCLDQASDDSRNTFASDMIKQMNHIEQQINAVTREASKPAGTVASGIESPTTKGSRKGTRGSSPGLARRATGPAETIPPSPAALRASLSLRLQFILRLFPIIYADREPSGRNMRCMLASVILRILGSRVVHEDASLSFSQAYSSRREVDSLVEAFATASVVMSTESLFDRLLLLLHGLLSSHQPRWLKWKSSSMSPSESSKDYSAFEREGAESLQTELDRMQLPETVRLRIQSAMPILFPSVRWSISCQPPSAAPAALSSLLPSNPISVLHSSNPSNQTQKNSVSLLRTATGVAGKTKHVSSQPENDLEVDPWILLEDGAGSSQLSSNSALVGGGDPANLRASNWLKGTVRVRRTDLTYIGAVDDDS